MNRTKKQESIIMISFVSYLALFIVMMGVALNYVYPHMSTIAERQNTAQIESENIAQLEKKWFKYEEISNLKFLAWSKNTLSQLIDKKFYDAHFTNKTGESYIKFLENKKEFLNNPEFLDKINEKEDQLIQILPSYVHTWGAEKKGFISDFQFVNYIESLISAFQLKYTGVIWVGSLEKLENYSLGEKNKNIFDTNIFKIPVRFSVEGYKKEILDFMYYTQNIWVISLETNQETNEKELQVLEDREGKFRTSRLRAILWWGNIYEQQLFDITKIYMPEYIDGSFNPRWSQSFVDFIKSDQWNKAFKMDIELNFYVKGIPKSKIEQDYQALLQLVQLTQKTISAGLKSPTTSVVKKELYTKMNASLKEISKQIKVLNSSKNNSDIEKKYLKITQYTETLHKFNKDLWYDNIYEIFLKNFKQQELGFKAALISTNVEDLYKQEKIKELLEQMKNLETKNISTINQPLYQEMVRTHAIIESLK